MGAVWGTLAALGFMTALKRASSAVAGRPSPLCELQGRGRGQETQRELEP